MGAISAIEDSLRGFCYSSLAKTEFFCLDCRTICLISGTRLDFFSGSHTNGSTGSPLAGKLVVVIGAGGAGKALAYGAKEKGARVVIANRTYG